MAAAAARKRSRGFPMKVCMIAYSFYESDSRIIQYSRSLTERGDEVDVIALAHDGARPFEVVDGVNVFRIQSRTINERGPLSYLVRILRFLFGAMFTLTQRHLHKRYDLVHVHSVPDFLIVSALPLRLMGVPVILDIHDILPEFYSSKFNKDQDSLIFRTLLLVEKISAALASHVIIANKIWFDRIVKRSISPERCTVICNYPDLGVFHPQPKPPANGSFVLMYPGSLNWHQGLDVALRAFAKASTTIKNAEFHIYGEGPTRPSLESLVQELALLDKVRIQDYRPVREIAALMANADLAVVPKRASSAFGNEAASTKVQEFMAVGVPVVLSRTKIDSLYFNDSVVRFFDSENIEALSDAIVDLYAHPERREKLIAGAFEYIKNNNWDVRQHDYLDLCDSLVKHR